MQSLLIAWLLTMSWMWDPPLTAVDGTPVVVERYVVYRSVDKGASFSALTCKEHAGDPLLLQKMCTDTAVPFNTHLVYYVTAVNSMGESEPSNRLSYFLPSARPEPPRQLREK